MASPKVAPKTPSISILRASRNVDDMVMSLIEGAYDDDTNVRSGVSEALVDIGRYEPSLVLSSCASFLHTNPKLKKEHRVVLLNAMSKVLDMKREEISDDLGVNLISLALLEMTSEKEVTPDWQTAASELLVVLGRRWCSAAMRALMEQFQPGQVPHYFTMKTMGDLASANPLDTVPLLKEVLARVIPVLGSIKHDNIRWVFASGMARFAEAILQYHHNLANVSDKSFSIDSFSSEMFPPYEVMFANWTKSTERKVRLATMQAMGHMCAIMAKEVFEAQVPKIIPFVLAMYKKEAPGDHFPITQAFVSILEAGTRNGSIILEPYLQFVYPALHQMIVRPPSSDDSSQLKNANELLRCIEIIARVFMDQTISFCLRAMESKDARTREATIEIFKHFVNRLEPFMAGKKELLVSGLQPLVQSEGSYSVRKTMCQLIIAMANQNYLQLEGGEALVAFITKNSSISDDEIERYNAAQKAAKGVDPNATSPSELRGICDHILSLMTTTISQTHPVLWPYLFEHICRPESTAAVGAVTKCIAVLAKEKKESGAADYMIDFDRAVALPKPHAIIARLIVMLNAPLRRGELGKNILDTLEWSAPFLHPSVSDMWGKTIPKISEFLEANKGSLNQQTWEDLILRLLTETLKIVNDDGWAMQVGECIVEQFALYQRDPELKKAAYKHLGVILQQISHKDFVRNKLDAIFTNCNHNNEHERQGAAQAFGYCANTHIDLTLEKLTNQAAKPAEAKESGGFFSSLFKSSSSDSGSSGAASGKDGTVILSYGYVTAFAKPTIISSRIESQILKNLAPHYGVKSPAMRELVIKSIDLIGKAMHPSHLKTKYELKQRDELLKTLLSYLIPDPKSKAPNVTLQIRVLAVNCATTLINLEPAIPSDLEGQLLEIISGFYRLKAEGPTQADDEKTIDLLHDNVNKMLAAVVFRDPTIRRIRSLFTRLTGVIGSDTDQQRKRAMTTILYLLKRLVEFITESEERLDTRFDNLGDTMSIFLPRVTDPDATVRQMAIEAVQIMLYLDHIIKLRAEEKDPSLDPPAKLAPFSDQRRRMGPADVNEQFAIVHEMSALLADVVPMVELAALLTGLVRGLGDSQPQSARGTCVLLYGLVSQRGSELTGEVARLVKEICGQMAGITNDQTLNGTLHAIRQLALAHMGVVVDQLLARDLPHPPYLVKAFQVLAMDSKLQQNIINHLVNALNKEEVIETKIVDKAKKTTATVATARSMATTVALGEIFLKDELSELVTSNHATLLPTLLLRLGSSAGFADATEQTVTTFKAFLTIVKDELILNKLNSEALWDKLKSESTYLEVITSIVAIACKSRRELMVPMFQLILPYMKSSYPGQRLVAATVLAEFINHSSHENDLLAKLVDAMLNSVFDNAIKIQALNGLANVTSCKPEQMDNYAQTVLDALLSNVEDQNESVSLASLTGLRRVMLCIDDKRIAPIIINLCHRMRPLLDRPSPGIRGGAAGMIGALARFGDGPASSQFTEQCHTLLPCFMLHFNDDDEGVRISFKNAMMEVAPFLKSDEVNKLFNGGNFDPKRNLNYDEFCNYVSRLLISSFPERVNNYVMTCVDPYFKSQWPTIKASAAVLVGALLGNIPKEKRATLNLNPGPVSKALILLLRENSPKVRSKAALAMAMLHMY